MNPLHLVFFAEHIKEAEAKKNKLTNKEKALIAGGGLSLLGLGALGAKMHSGAKDTEKIVSRVNKSVDSSNAVLKRSKKRKTASEFIDKLTSDEANIPMSKNRSDLLDSSGFEAAQDNIDRANKKLKNAEDTLNKIEKSQKARQSAAPPTYGSDEYFEQMRQATREDMLEMMKLREKARRNSDGIKYEKYQKEVRRLATALGEDPDVWSVS